MCVASSSYFEVMKLNEEYHQNGSVTGRRQCPPGRSKVFPHGTTYAVVVASTSNGLATDRHVASWGNMKREAVMMASLADMGLT